MGVLAKREPLYFILNNNRGVKIMLKMIAIGNITNDVELEMKESSSKPYAILRLAAKRRYKDRDGNKLTDFISVKVRGKLAEICKQYWYKGCKIAAGGDFETITFAEDSDRQPGFLLKASEVEFISPKKSEEKTENNPKTEEMEVQNA